MGFFDRFKLQKEEVGVIEEIHTEEVIVPTEEQFIDNSEPKETKKEERAIEKYGLKSIYDYAEIDFEKRGFDDALINPDTAYKQDNINLIIEDLNIKIRRAKDFYIQSLRHFDFHIKSRGDAGLIDTVNELQSSKSIYNYEFEKVLEIEKETENLKGLSSRLQLSYSRGFNRGLASLSNKLLNQ